jgi:mannose-6-phosphate isomerase-like protein (cupin superfamily)
MKRFIPLAALASLLIMAFGTGAPAGPGFILEHEKDIAKTEPGPHEGKGQTTAFPFFQADPSFGTVFRKRILHPGSSIGYHLQEKHEVYYVISGNGTMEMNGKSFTVTAGDAILTQPGSHHGLRNDREGDLTILIVYAKQ